MKWIALVEKKPMIDGKYLTLRKGFTYDMGNDAHLEPWVGYWNGGRGCFDEDYRHSSFIYWMPIPELPSEVT